MFSLDVFSPGLSASQILIGLLMHNIPVFVLMIILIISWKYEIIGGIAFLLAGLLYIFRRTDEKYCFQIKQLNRSCRQKTNPRLG